MPFGAVTGLQGVGDTPTAINKFALTTRDFATIVRDWPERTRWQVELLLLEAESSGAISQALKRIEVLQQQMAGLSQVLAGMPTETATQADVVVTRMQRLTDRLALEAAALVLLILLCALFYRLVVRRRRA